MSDMVTIRTRYPEWTYTDKDDNTYCSVCYVMLYYDHLKLYLTHYSQWRSIVYRYVRFCHMWFQMLRIVESFLK
jgi:hypothetical protein